jgi:hypothetical protein
MPTFLYTCPVMSLTVQCWIADDPARTGDEVYEPVNCLACTRVHLVNRTTGGILGVDYDE